MNTGSSMGGNPPARPNNSMPQNSGPPNMNNMGPPNQNMGQRPPENSKAEEDPFAKSLGGNMLGSDNGPSNMGMMGAMGRDSISSRGSNNSMGMSGGMPKQAPPMNNAQNNQVKSMMEGTIREQERMIQSRKDDIAGLNGQFNANNQLLNSLKEKSERLRKELDKLNSEYKSLQGKVNQQNQEIKNEVNNISNMTSQLSTAVGNMRNMGGPGNFVSPRKDMNQDNFRGVRASHDNMEGMGGMASTRENNMNSGMNQRQPRMMGGPPNGHGGNMPGGMNNRNMRPQSSDPHKTLNIQPQSFGNMGQPQQRQNNDDFYTNNGMNGGGYMNGAPDTSAENIDWGL